MERPGASVEESEDSPIITVLRWSRRKSKTAIIKRRSSKGCLLGGAATLSGLNVCWDPLITVQCQLSVGERTMKPTLRRRRVFCLAVGLRKGRVRAWKNKGQM